MSIISSDLSRVVQYLENPGPYRAPKHHLYDVLESADLCIEVFKYLQPFEELSKIARTSKLFRDAVPLVRSEFIVEFHLEGYKKLLPSIFRSIPRPILSDEQLAAKFLKLPHSELNDWLQFLVHLTDEQFQKYQEAFTRNFPRIEIVNFRYSYEPLCLYRIFPKGSVSVFNFDGFSSGIDDLTLTKILNRQPQITQLHMSPNCSLSKETCLNCLPKLKRLHTLDLPNANNLDDDVLIAVAAKGDLITINVMGTQVSDRGISELVRNNPRLTHLCISESTPQSEGLLTEMGIKSLEDHAKNLVSLKLSHYRNIRLSKETIRKLISQLPNLREFFLFDARSYASSVNFFSVKEKEELQELYPKITFYYNLYDPYIPNKGPK